MRSFYLEYQNSESLSRISQAGNINSESAIRNLQNEFSLSWTHYLQLLKLRDKDERRFYELEASRNNWSVRELKRQIGSSLYERLALSRDKDAVLKLAQEGQILEKSTDILKQPFVLEFLNLKEDHRYSENDLETAIINKLEHFMLELGKAFYLKAGSAASV